MNRILVAGLVGLVGLAAACGDSTHAVKITLFQAAPDAVEAGQSTKLLFVVDPPDAKLTITGLGDVGSLGDVTGQTQIAVTPASTTTYHLTATSGSSKASGDVTVTVGPQIAGGIKVEATNPTPTAGEATPFTLTAITSDGKTAPGFRGTIHLTSTDAKAELPGDVAFTASDAGVKQVMVMLKTAGVSTLTGTDTASPARQGAASVTVQPGPASAYQLTALPASALAGEALVLTITARDAFGNVATSYGGQAKLTSTDPSDVLPAAGAFTAGVRTVNVEFTKVGGHLATVSALGGAIPPIDTSSVAIAAAAPVEIRVTAAHATTIAGTPEAFTATLVDFFGNLATNYTGTVHFASTDASAVVPADFTFTAADAGTHGFTTTLKTAGAQTLALGDTASARITGAAAWDVGPAAAVACTAGQAPAAASAGSVVGVAVVVRDAFGNVATSYAGTIALTASDLRATLPPNVTYVPLADAGSHVFSAELITTGTQTLTATDLADPAIQCTAAIAITPGAPKLVVSVPGNASAGYAVTVGIAAKDLFDNAIPGYAGTVSFTSTDTGAGAVTPAPITFTGGQGGVATTSATFVTLGAQTLAAADAGSPAANGNASSTVHGLVYTSPDTGRVRLVANAAASNTQIVQLDLVANERLVVSPFFGGGPGSFAAGMNLPLDTTRAAADATLFTPGPALPAGTGTRAAVGRIGATDHVLYTAVSRKRVAGTVFTQSTEVQAGQVFYSVRLKLQPVPSTGPVFDGAQPSTLYRAAIRDQYGDDFVSQAEFGVGKLEVR